MLYASVVHHNLNATINVLVIMAEEFSPEESEVYEQRLRGALDYENNTSMHGQNMLDCVENMATNAQASGTQSQYKGAQNRLRNYLRKVKPDYILPNDEIKLPLSKEVFLSYVGFITYFRGTDDKPLSKYSIKSAESVNGEIAAIKSLYAKNELQVATDIETKVKAHMKGLKRLIQLSFRFSPIFFLRNESANYWLRAKKT